MLGDLIASVLLAKRERRLILQQVPRRERLVAPLEGEGHFPTLLAAAWCKKELSWLSRGLTLSKLFSFHRAEAQRTSDPRALKMLSLPPITQSTLRGDLGKIRTRNSELQAILPQHGGHFRSRTEFPQKHGHS